MKTDTVQSKNEALPPFKPRRPYDDDQPDGLLESDRDFLENNLELAVALLEAHGATS